MAITGTTTISQLSALNSASLDTTLVGVDNGITYKIELDVVADAVSDRINTLDEQRLTNLEQFTSSVSGTDIIISGSVVFSGSGQSNIKTGVLYAGKGYYTTNSFDIGAIQYPKYNYGSGDVYLLRANDTNINISGAYYNFEEYITQYGSLILQNSYSSSNTDSGDPSALFTGSVTAYEVGGHSPYIALGGIHTSLVNVYGSASFNGVAQLTAGTTFVQNFFGAGGVNGSGFFQMSRTGNRSIGGTSQSSYHAFGMISTGSASNAKRTLAKNGSNYTIGWFNDNLNGGTPGQERFEIIAYNEIAGTTSHPSGQVSASVFYHHKSTNKIGLGTNQLLNTQNTISGSTTLIGSVISTNGFTGSIAATNGLVSSSAQITAFGFVSGSYETTGRGIISSSANLVTTSSFNSYTASISTASLVTSISNLNSATSSYLTSLSGAISSSSQLTSSFDTRYALSASFVSSSNLSSIQTITSASYAALTPVSGTLYIIIG